ncbi:MAG: ribosome small subunit-dependent GTPase A [Coriobacteriales bacterium]
MIPFEHLGATEQIETTFRRTDKKLEKRGRRCVLGRVVSLDRGFPLVRTEYDEERAELSASIKKSVDSIVAVGDWVAVERPDSHEKAIIHAVLPRTTELARVKRVGREKQLRRQVLAANVGTVFICQSLTGDGLDRRLLIRQMAAVMGCGAKPVFVLTKSDLVSREVVDGAVSEIVAVAPDIPLLVISKDDPDSVGRVRELISPGTTSLLLGESGVGKSSLVNALLGREAADVGRVRESDDRGRHTTVARRMIEVPGAGLIIDAPGLRTLQILDMDTSLRRAFPDIANAAGSCKFRDCSHNDEPGCAVREEIPAARLAAWRYLKDSDWR